ncbi:hypothetical protein TWF718_009818 [Orbilia javanica]|uniref:F-box domain-containing protein n=1 Tax=Orbilia javanica TaxID=47235 RepID=A0AAN8RLP8_9PEZI
MELSSRSRATLVGMPIELKLHILEACTFPAFVALASTCKTFHEAAWDVGFTEKRLCKVLQNGVTRQVEAINRFISYWQWERRRGLLRSSINENSVPLQTYDDNRCPYFTSEPLGLSNKHNNGPVAVATGGAILVPFDPYPLDDYIGYGCHATRFIDMGNYMRTIFHIQIAAHNWARAIYKKTLATGTADQKSQLDLNKLEEKVYAAWAHALIDEAVHQVKYAPLTTYAKNWLENFCTKYRGFPGRPPKEVMEIYSIKVFVVEKCLPIGRVDITGDFRFDPFKIRKVPTNRPFPRRREVHSQLLKAKWQALNHGLDYYRAYFNKISQVPVLDPLPGVADIRLDFELGLEDIESYSTEYEENQ